MEPERQPSRAEQRMAAVAKLKRAASLPRMKDGRRPPMHPEAVSEGEKARPEEEEKKDEKNDAPSLEKINSESTPSPPGVAPEVEVDIEREEPPTSPEPPSRAKRRSRSRSRSRGSKDFKGKAKNFQAAPLTPVMAGDSSQDEAPTPAAGFTSALDVFTPIPSPLPALQRSVLLRSPTPTLGDALFHPTFVFQSPSSPRVPTLEDIQQQYSLMRSVSSGGNSTALGRRLALQKLNGVIEPTIDASPPSTPPPPTNTSKLGRNNTVSGGERIAIRQNMLKQLERRVAKEEQVSGSGGEDPRVTPSVSPPPQDTKRRKRRSGRGSAIVSEDTRSNTPVLPPSSPPPYAREQSTAHRAQSSTPGRGPITQNRLAAHSPEPPEPVPLLVQEPVKPELLRRRSVIVEEEDDDDIPPPPQLPRTPQRHTPNGSTTGLHNLTETSIDPAPTYLLPQRTPSRAPSRTADFNDGPFKTPLRERMLRDEDEEQVLYPAERNRSRLSDADSIHRGENDREHSWIGNSVGEIRMPIHDEDDDQPEDHDGERYPEGTVPSTRSSNAFPTTYEISPRVSADSKSLIVESEATMDNTLPHTFSLSSTSTSRPQDDAASPQSYPARLSVASRSPMIADFSLDETKVNQEPTRRNGDASPSTWEKVKVFVRSGSSGGRRSRTNSNTTRESAGAFIPQTMQPQPIATSLSASASTISLAPHVPVRGTASPLPPASSVDLLKLQYMDSKLNPFPGMKTLEEQRNRARGLAASASSPDVSFPGGGQDEDHPPLSSSSIPSTPMQALEPTRGPKLYHQASDTRLLAKYNQNASPVLTSPSTSQTDYFNVSTGTPRSGLSQPQSSSGSGKLPTTVPGVKQWMKMFLPQPQSVTQPAPAALSSPPVLELPAALSPTPGRRLSLSAIFKQQKEVDLSTDWEDVGLLTPSPSQLPQKQQPVPQASKQDTNEGHKSPSVATYYKAGSVRSSANSNSAGTAGLRSDPSDTERTPKVKNTIFTDSIAESNLSSLPCNSSTSLAPASTTPDLSQSSDYPPPTTSESSSTSSHYSLPGVGQQGAVVLERLDEGLATRGSRIPSWAPSIDEHSRKLILSAAVLQVVKSDTVKDRFLFLFNDILVIAKPILQDKDNLLELHQKPSPPDRRYIVKNVVLLSQLRFNADRSEPSTATKASYGSSAPRNPAIRQFISNFAKEPDLAVTTLFSRSGVSDDRNLLGQLLFKTFELDRVKLGEYLARRTTKSELKAYLDSFGFYGLRIDLALRVFLLSFHLPSRPKDLEYLLDSFAARWYEANRQEVVYDKDLAIRLVRTIIQLNDLLHKGIASDVGRTEYPQSNISSRDFINAMRRFDARGSVPDDLLDTIYESIHRERLSQARNVPSSSDVLILVKKPVPPRLTYKVQSEPIIVRIPAADPGLTIQLYGQGLRFDPPELTFSKSPEASFRVTGEAVGSKRVVMLRSGPNAIKYTGLPFSNDIVVERAFMRNTFQVAFLDHHNAKRRYMFSVDDPVMRHQWVLSLKNQAADAKMGAVPPVAVGSPESIRFYKAAHSLAFRILQESLVGLGSVPTSSSSSKKTPDGLPGGLGSGLLGSSQKHGNGHVNGDKATIRGPSHLRSKSRSKFYHKYGAGKDELDLSDGQDMDEYNDGGVTSDTQLDEPFSPPNDNQLLHLNGPIWSSQDIVLQCSQNSAISLILSHLQASGSSASSLEHHQQHLHHHYQHQQQHQQQYQPGIVSQ